MCTGAELLLATTAASSALSYIGGQQQLKATQQAATDNYTAQMEQNKVRQEEINKQSANDSSERARQAQIERGKMRVITGESGALGVSADRIINDSLFNEGMDISTIESNRESAIKQTNADANSLRAQNQSVINTAASKAPTLLGTGLQIGGAYGTYKGGIDKSISKFG
jgi:hypothetical protein